MHLLLSVAMHLLLSVDVQIVYILGFAGYRVSVSTINSAAVAQRQPSIVHKKIGVAAFQSSFIDRNEQLQDWTHGPQFSDIWPKLSWSLGYGLLLLSQKLCTRDAMKTTQVQKLGKYKLLVEVLFIKTCSPACLYTNTVLQDCKYFIQPCTFKN